VILRTRAGSNLELRDANADAFVPPVPPPGVLPVTTDEVTTLPVVISAGRLISESIAGMCLDVFREDPATGVRVDADDAWQSDLLGQPNMQMSGFQWVEHTVWSMLFYGNALSLKSMTRGEVTELFPLNPESFTIQRDPATGNVQYKVRITGGSWYEIPRSSLLHIVGKTTADPMIGKGLIELAAPTYRKHLHAEVYARRFFENDATPGGIVTVQGRMTKPQRDELRESWNSRHQGPANGGKVAVLDNGAAYQSIGISPKDVQFVELAKFSVQETARIFTIPLGFMADTEARPVPDAEAEDSRLLRHGIGPWVNRIERALNADRDLFPDGSNLCAEFDVDDLVRADMASRYGAYNTGRQGGWLSINDIREQEDLPPIPGGDEYLQTPVGGAPNLQPTPGMGSEE